MTLRLAQIFQWDIDFVLDIRKGDEFSVLFEEKYVDGEFIGFGKILAAEFVNQEHEVSSRATTSMRPVAVTTSAHPARACAKRSYARRSNSAASARTSICGAFIRYRSE